MATGHGTAKGTTAHTEADAHGKGGFPPFQSETFASQLVSFAIAFALLYFIVSKFALPRVGGVILCRGRKAEVEALARTDPFVTEGVSDVTVTEFATSFAAPEIAALLG